jgi:hypothetical protein
LDGICKTEFLGVELFFTWLVKTQPEKNVYNFSNTVVNKKVAIVKSENK